MNITRCYLYAPVDHVIMEEGGRGEYNNNMYYLFFNQYVNNVLIACSALEYTNL